MRTMFPAAACLLLLAGALALGCGSTPTPPTPPADVDATIVGTTAGGVQGYVYVPATPSAAGTRATASQADGPFTISMNPVPDEDLSPCEGGQVDLMVDGRVVQTSDTDEDGRFSFKSISARDYDLRVRFDEDGEVLQQDFASSVEVVEPGSHFDIEAGMGIVGGNPDTEIWLLTTGIGVTIPDPQGIWADYFIFGLASGDDPTELPYALFYLIAQRNIAPGDWFGFSDPSGGMATDYLYFGGVALPDGSSWFFSNFEDTSQSGIDAIGGVGLTEVGPGVIGWVSGYFNGQVATVRGLSATGGVRGRSVSTRANGRMALVGTFDVPLLRLE